MPWKEQSIVGERLRLMGELLRGERPVSQWCRIYGISRKTAYKWKARFLSEGRSGLADRCRRPHRLPRRLGNQWIKRIRLLHQKHPTWGPKKIQAWFAQQKWRAPSGRTIARWRKRLGLTRARPPRSRKACVRVYPKLTKARAPNEVWTVDFKGWFCTGNGERVEPLTVRDLFSRYGLLIGLLPDQRWGRVKAALAKLFRQRGLPAVIRVDNGGPFASTGPAGLSRLSAWWVRLGIRVEFTRPARPQDNGSHEQFHRVMKRETTRPPAQTARGQQQRTTVLLRGYNHLRPHEALGQKTPVRFYRKSRRRFPKTLGQPSYLRHYQVRRVRSNGEIRWRAGNASLARLLSSRASGCGDCGGQFMPFTSPTS